MQGNQRQSWILDSTVWIPNSRYSIPHSLLVETEFQIPIISGIPDSLSCILDSKACSFPDSISKTFLDSGIWINLHEARKQNCLNLNSMAVYRVADIAIGRHWTVCYSSVSSFYHPIIITIQNYCCCHQQCCFVPLRGNN